MLHGYGDQLMQGTFSTLRLAGAALVLGSLLGAAGCWLQLSTHRAFRAVGHAYTTAVRGVPDLLIVFAVYFGGSLMLASLTGRNVEVDAFFAGVAALAVSFGAYVAEIARGALLSVPAAQRDAARMLGLTRTRTLWSVVMPQAARIALAPFGNQSIVLLKQTSIVSIVGCSCYVYREPGDPAFRPNRSRSSWSPPG